LWGLVGLLGDDLFLRLLRQGWRFFENHVDSTSVLVLIGHKTTTTKRCGSSLGHFFKIFHTRQHHGFWIFFVIVLNWHGLKSRFPSFLKFWFCCWKIIFVSNYRFRFRHQLIFFVLKNFKFGFFSSRSTGFLKYFKRFGFGCRRFLKHFKSRLFGYRWFLEYLKF